jgi:hypothetical protein
MMKSVDCAIHANFTEDMPLKLKIVIHALKTFAILMSEDSYVQTVTMINVISGKIPILV